MIKDIDDAIIRARDVASKKRKQAEEYSDNPYDFNSAVREVCLECAEEHEQLVSWLEELKQRREVDKWVSAKERMPDKDGVYIVVVQYTAKYEKGSPTHTIELLVSYDTKYGQWSTPDDVIAWQPLPEYTESEG